jgi:hypothetical protein
VLGSAFAFLEVTQLIFPVRSIVWCLPLSSYGNVSVTVRFSSCLLVSGFSFSPELGLSCSARSMPQIPAEGRWQLDPCSSVAQVWSVTGRSWQGELSLPTFSFRRSTPALEPFPFCQHLWQKLPQIRLQLHVEKGDCSSVLCDRSWEVSQVC